MHKLPSESAKAYAAFKMYAEMGSERSTNRVARKLAKSGQLIRRWSAKHMWVERVVEFDARLDRTAKEAEEQRLIDSAGIWARRMLETREEAFQLAAKLIEKAEAMLKFPLAVTTSQDGKTTVKPTRWTVGDVARLIETASRLKQLATGLPTDRCEHSGPEGKPLADGGNQVVFYVPANGREDHPN